MKTLIRGIMGKNDGIDTTVRAKIPFVSPDWEHVLGLQQGKLKREEYASWYTSRLEEGREEVYQWANTLPTEATLLCYCKVRGFCHNKILIEFLVANWPEEFQEKQIEIVRSPRKKHTKGTNLKSA